MARKFYLYTKWGRKLLEESIESDDPQINGYLQTAHNLLKEGTINFTNAYPDLNCRDYGYKVWKDCDLGQFGIYCGNADDISEMLMMCENNKKLPDDFAFVAYDNDFVAWYFNEKLYGYVDIMEGDK